MASIALTPLSMNTTHNNVHHRHSPHSATRTTPVIETTPALGSGDRADTGDDNQPGRRSGSVDGEDIDRFISGRHVIQ